jgi:hypothetical protein
MSKIVVGVPRGRDSIEWAREHGSVVNWLGATYRTTKLNYKLMRVSSICGVALISITIHSRPAHAQAPAQGCFLGLDIFCPSPPPAPPKPPIDLLPPKNLTPLSPGKFYIVNVVCDLRKDPAITFSDGILVKEGIGVTESLWFSNAGSSLDGKLPASSVKLINFASASIANTGNISFNNRSSCDEKFIIQGTASNLTVLYGKQDSKTLSTFGNLVYTALNLGAGIGSAFAGGPLAKAAIADVTAAAKTEDSVKAIITGANQDPTLTSESWSLGTSSKPQVVTSPIGRVLITITPISDISSAIIKDRNFTRDFYQMIDSLSSSSLATGATSSAQCASFAAQYITNDYLFTDKDQAFLLGYFALKVSAGDKTSPGDVGIRLDCIGSPQKSLYVLKFPYNRQFGQLRPIIMQDILNKWPNPDNVPTPYNPVPLPPPVAQQYLNALVIAMGAYSQNHHSDDTRQKLLAITGAGKFTVTDITNIFWPLGSDSTAVAADDLVDKLDGADYTGYTRFGCFYYNPGSGYDATFLALPTAPAATPATPPAARTDTPKYNLNELLAIQVGINANKASKFKANIRLIQLTADYSTISTTATQNGWSCGNKGTAQINPPPKPQ